jgi:energy-coupling factor transporter transmembrane protein EcfT
MIEYMLIVKYCISTFVTILLVGFLIVVIYIMRSIIKIPKGPYTWITNICTFILFLFVSVSLILGLVYFSPRGSMEEDLSKTNFSSTTRIDQPDFDAMIKMELRQNCPCLSASTPCTQWWCRRWLSMSP